MVSGSLTYSRTRCHLRRTLTHRIRRNLHNRAIVRLPRPKNIIKYCKQHHGARHQHTEIHMGGSNRGSYRPEAKEEDDDAEYDGPGVYYDAEDTGQVKGAPDELICFACVVGDVCRHADRASAAPPEEEAFGDDVRCV